MPHDGRVTHVYLGILDVEFDAAIHVQIKAEEKSMPGQTLLTSISKKDRIQNTIHI